MLTLFVLVPLVLAALIVSSIVRLLVRPFGYRHRGYGAGFGRRRRHGFGGALLSILALVALDRLFTGRRF